MHKKTTKRKTIKKAVKKKKVLKKKVINKPKEPKEPKEPKNICPECGKLCVTKYCSIACKYRFYRKLNVYLKNKCIVCGKPSHKDYCSIKCSKASIKNPEIIAFCAFCGKEFIIERLAYLKRGMKFCSDKCKTSKYKLQDNFFTHGENISDVYKMMGFIFAAGIISDIILGIIDIVAEKEKMHEFAETIKSNYLIYKTDGENMFRTMIRSKEMCDYLFTIGFSSNKETHDFPSILPEYKLNFIKGYASVNFELHQNGEVMFINTKSYYLAKGISEFLNCELVTKQLGFVCIIRQRETIRKIIL